MKLRFSVVVPVYNKKPHLERCITSVLNQSYTDFELIIIDDGSTDGSYDELLKFSDSRIKLFRRSKSNRGAAEARNCGIDKATSKWIAFLDADDEWYPDHLEKTKNVIQHFDGENVGIVGAGFKSITNNKVILQKYYVNNAKIGMHIIKLEDVLKEYIKNIRFGNTSVITVKKEVIQKVGGFSEGKTQKGEDLIAWIKILSISNGIWSPHIGANTYHNAVNKLTHTTYFNIAYFKSVVDSLDLTKNQKRMLKIYVNTLIRKDFIRYLIREGEKPYLLNQTLYNEDSKLLKLLNILDYFPNHILKILVVIKRYLN